MGSIFYSLDIISVTLGIPDNLELAKDFFNRFHIRKKVRENKKGYNHPVNANHAPHRSAVGSAPGPSPILHHRFAANLRMGADVPPQDKAREVESILDLLELRSFADMIVGQEAIGEGVFVALQGMKYVLFAELPVGGLAGCSSLVVGKPLGLS